MRARKPRRLTPALLAIAIVTLVVLGAQAAVGEAAVPLSISISGNHFVNGEGQTIRLLGVNHQSFEYGCVDGFGYDDGHMDDADAAAIAAWGANAVRVPLNEDCWEGLNGQPNNKEELSQTFTEAGYREAVQSYVASLNAHGIYAILDLHWSAPGAMIADGQQPMPDGHSIGFWTSVASTFKEDPAVVFDVFNEPYSPTDERSGTDENPQDSVSWACWRNGGCETAAYEHTTALSKSKYVTVGMQTLVSAIRHVEASQPIIVGGLDYANDLTGWLANAPEDPLGQLAASFHNYMGKTCNNISCWNSQVAPVAANVPVVTGEFAEHNFEEAKCATKTPSTFDQDYMGWADEHGIGYTAWGWTVLNQKEKDEEGCDAYYLIDDYNGTPAAPNGTVIHAHLLSLAGGGQSPGGGGAPGGTTPGPGSKPAVALKILRDAVQAGGRTVGFTLRSPQSCTGTITGRTVKSFLATTKHRRHPLSLGTVHFSLKAGKTKTVVLTLSRAARRLLAAKHTLRVRFTITLSSAAHRTTVIQQTVSLRTPTRHH